MRIARRGFVFAVTLGVVLTVAAGCGGLAHGTNDDGNDVTNPLGQNPGTPTLSLSAANNSVAVGSYLSITPTYNGAVLINNGSMGAATLSDSSVISGSAFGVEGLSVGSGTITATYQGSSASITFAVVPQNGVDGIMSIFTNVNTGVAAWFPATMHVAVGSAVQFQFPPSGVQHNVVYDAVPGAPPNIAAGATGFGTVSLFNTAGSFPFHCTIHGEAGVINVIAP